MEKESVKAAEKRLSCYALYKKILDNGTSDEYGDGINVRAELFRIRRTVLSMPDSKERFFLYNRYIHGRSTEKCAELLGISRRSAFRLRQRALVLYAQREKTEKPTECR